MFAEWMNKWMNQSIKQWNIFMFPYEKQRSKDIQQDHWPAGLDIKLSFIFLCLSSLPSLPPHHGFLALSVKQVTEVAVLCLREHSFKGKLANRQKK